MNNTPFVSIIIPVYNTVLYLSKCLDSIISQSFKQWECLLIDDGSTDQSSNICDNYALKDNRIRVFHKENGGVSSARNLGIEKALGKWLLFVDGDDFIGTEYLKGLLSPIIEGNQVGFVHGGCMNYENDSITTVNQEYEYYLGEDKGLLFRSFRGLVVSKLFNSVILHDKELRFDERMRIAEDMAFTIDYLLYVSKYAFVPEVGYYYRRDNSSSSTHKIKTNNYTIARHSFEHLYDSFMLFIKQNDVSYRDAHIRFEQLANHMLAMLVSLYYDKSISKANRMSNLRQWIDSDYSWLLQYLNRGGLDQLSVQILLGRHFYLFDCLQRTKIAYSRVRSLLRNNK